MNIWIFNHYATIPSLPGGTRHFDLARQLVRRGHDVTIFASAVSHHGSPKVRLPDSNRWIPQEIEDVRFVWLRTPTYARNDWRRVLSMVAFMLRAWRIGTTLPSRNHNMAPPDVVIGSSVHLLAVLAAYWVAKRHRSRFVMEVRDLWPQTLIDMGYLTPRHPLTRLLQRLERFLYQRAESIITLLPMADDYIHRCGVPREKVVWIPNGVDLSRFPQGASDTKMREEFTVMYLGAHGEANALDVLIQAAHVLQSRGKGHVRLILVGRGLEKPRLLEKASALGLENVEFRDPIPKDHVPSSLAQADALVVVLRDLPLYRYGISLNKLFDYLAAARPVILAGAPANNPVNDADCGITVPPGNPEALAEAIGRLSELSPREREAMGLRGRAYVEEHHDIVKLAERLERVLEEPVRGS